MSETTTDKPICTDCAHRFSCQYDAHVLRTKCGFYESDDKLVMKTIDILQTYLKNKNRHVEDTEEVEVLTSGDHTEYWGAETICQGCGTRWMAYDKADQRIARYCPGCGKKVTGR